MMRIDGYICQIIQPKDQNLYFAKWFANEVKGKYVLTINRNDVPRKWWQYFHWHLKHRKEGQHTFWRVVMEECSLEEGDSVSLEVEPYMQSVAIWTPTKQTQPIVKDFSLVKV